MMISHCGTCNIGCEPTDCEYHYPNIYDENGYSLNYNKKTIELSINEIIEKKYLPYIYFPHFVCTFCKHPIFLLAPIFLPANKMGQIKWGKRSWQKNGMRFIIQKNFL